MSRLPAIEAHSYLAEIDLSEISEGTMTDQGMTVGEVKEIDSCSLTPGDPSPVGRTEDGDLVYPVFPARADISVTRRTAAELAHLYAKAHGITEIPGYPRKSPEEITFVELLQEALPEVLFSESNHGKISYEGALQAVLAGDWAHYPERLMTDLEKDLKGKRALPRHIQSLDSFEAA